MSSRSTPRWLLPALLIVAFVTATFAFNHGRAVWTDQYDDAYITYRYAVNLATGKGLVFNSYERVNSASSFLYTLLLAGAYRVGVHDLERFAALFGLAMGSVLVVVTFLMARAATGRARAAFFFTLPLCLAGSIGGWAVSGMETIFFAALIATFLHLYLFTTAAKALSFALLGLALLTRVEALLLFGVVAVRELLGPAPPPPGDRRRDLIRLALLAAAPVAALAAFDLVYYGSAIPHAVTLKRVSNYYSPGLGAQLAAVGRFYLESYAGYVALAGVAMAGAGSALRGAARAGLPPLPFLSLYVALSFASFIVGPFSDMQRYTVHVLPALAVLALAGWLRLRPPRPRDLAPVAVVVVLVMGALWNGYATAQELGLAAEHQRARRQIGEWLNRNARPGDRIASADLGRIAYIAQDYDFVDVFGLTSAGFAELSQTAPAQLPALFERLRPAYIADTAFELPGAAAGDPPAALTSTELILAKPWVAFRGVRADSTAPARPPYPRRPLLRLRAADRAFMIAAIDWP
jgi:arabinofuranosyltransferase